jgi:D-amino-acid oxidase
MEITVVGAGIIGLTTAVTLEERGHRVRVVAAARGAQITSSVAAAIWFPYRAGPVDKVTAWARRTRTWLEQLARDVPDAGVDLVTTYEIVADGGSEQPWWAEGGELVPAPVTGAPRAWRLVVPRAQPSLLLPYLESQLRGPIEERRVTDLAAEPGAAIINCTGLGARELAGDRELSALLGQVVIAEPGDTQPNVSITDDRDPDRVFYLIPRRDELVLGGCSLAVPSDHATLIDPNISERILAQARALGLAIGAVRGERVGLRPYRAEVRLARDPHEARVIHNYGHGGAGFTLCRGCAEDVAALL